MIAAIRTRTGDLHQLDPQDPALTRGQFVVYETERGLDCSPVVFPPSAIVLEHGKMPTVRYLRPASDQDMLQLDTKWREEARAHKIGIEKIAAHGLPMKLLETMYTLDFSRLTFFYTADGRVDFRQLLKDLTSTFRRTRIELRQIGVRDAAGMMGGVGACGRELCCATFLKEFAPITIKLAKDQNLPLNPTKISGLCGRLMCCLSYEHEMYLEIKHELPVVGSRVKTSEGTGFVIEQVVMKEAVKVEITDDLVVEVPLSKLIDYQVPAKPSAKAARPDET
jgi:cell fate regulator YaaT (PSP1 superfamily)